MKLLTYGVFFLFYHAVALAQSSPGVPLRDKPRLDKAGTVGAKDEKLLWSRVNPNDSRTKPLPWSNKPIYRKWETAGATDEKLSWPRVDANDPRAQPVPPTGPEFCIKYPELCMPAQEDFIANNPRAKPVSPSDPEFCIKHPEKCLPNPKARTAQDTLLKNSIHGTRSPELGQEK